MTLPRYPAYKDSGVEWLGEIPEHWEVGPLKRMVSIQNGADYKDVQVDDGYPVIGSGGVFSFASDFLYDGESVLFGRKGTIDKPLYVTGRFWTVDTMYWSKILPGTNGRFCYYVALTIPYGYYATSTALPSITKLDLNSHKVPIAPLLEQASIVSFLDHETSKIDALIAEQQNLIALLKEKRQAVISHAVNKGLNPDVPMKDSGVEWLGEVPEHWHVSPLKWLTGPGRDIMYGIVLPGPNVEQGVPIVKGGDVRPARLRKELLNRTTAEIEAPFARARLNPGDIVYSIRGSIGDAELVPEELRDANITQDVARISPHAEVCGRWLLFVMKSAPIFVQLEQRSLGAAVRGINIFDLKRALIPVPSSAEQEAIADFLERQTVMIDSLITESEHAVALLKERRSALISAAVTGKIDVRGLVPQEAA